MLFHVVYDPFGTDPLLIKVKLRETTLALVKTFKLTLKGAKARKEFFLIFSPDDCHVLDYQIKTILISRISIVVM